MIFYYSPSFNPTGFLNGIDWEGNSLFETLFVGGSTGHAALPSAMITPADFMSGSKWGGLTEQEFASVSAGPVSGVFMRKTATKSKSLPTGAGEKLMMSALGYTAASDGLYYDIFAMPLHEDSCAETGGIYGRSLEQTDVYELETALAMDTDTLFKADMYHKFNLIPPTVETPFYKLRTKVRGYVGHSSLTWPLLVEEDEWVLVGLLGSEQTEDNAYAYMLPTPIVSKRALGTVYGGYIANVRLHAQTDTSIMGFVSDMGGQMSAVSAAAEFLKPTSARNADALAAFKDLPRQRGFTSSTILTTLSRGIGIIDYTGTRDFLQAQHTIPLRIKTCDMCTAEANMLQGITSCKVVPGETGQQFGVYNGEDFARLGVSQSHVRLSCPGIFDAWQTVSETTSIWLQSTPIHIWPLMWDHTSNTYMGLTAARTDFLADAVAVAKQANFIDDLPWCLGGTTAGVDTVNNRRVVNLASQASSPFTDGGENDSAIQQPLMDEANAKAVVVVQFPGSNDNSDVRFAMRRAWAAL